MRLKLGKRPARKGAVKFSLDNYVDYSQLPEPPKSFGPDEAIPEWGILGNDVAGDCVFADAAHETILWNAESSRDVPFTDQSVLSDYSALTGYNPDDPNSDQGTDMAQAAEYRRTVGVLDGDGARHVILAYLALQPGNLRQLYIAMYLFGAVSVGIRFPASAMEQFDKGQIWTPTDSPIEGGHCIPMIARRRTLRRKSWLTCVTWGKLQTMTEDFYRTYNDEALAYVSAEYLEDGVTPDGFNQAQLLEDLQKLKPAPKILVD